MRATSSAHFPLAVNSTTLPFLNDAIHHCPIYQRLYSPLFGLGRFLSLDLLHNQ
jgi:hypothetical protein